MHPQQRLLLGINVIGGFAVLASYAWGLATHEATRHALWGGLPAGLRPLYTVSMVTAAIGYFPFTYLLLFGTDPVSAKVGPFGFGTFAVLYLLILLPSAMWMPLTFHILDHWDPRLWVAIRVVLAVVGLASVGMTVALLALTPPAGAVLRWLAISGALAFTVQTGLLDACVWPIYFGR